MLSERRHSILNLVAQTYIATARPVASQHVAEQLAVSSATVRNEFVALEERGLLQQQHASSGRIPSLAGLGRYASSFIPPGSLPRRQRHFIRSRISQVHGDHLLQGIATLAAELSGYAVVVKLPSGGDLHAIQVHLSELSTGRLMVVVVLENGLVRQQVVELVPMPDTATIEEAESSLRQLAVPLDHLGAAIRQLARSREGDLQRMLLVLADAAADLNPTQLFSHGLGYLLAEPEAQDPEFIKRAVREVESPDSSLLDSKDLDLELAGTTARIRAALQYGRLRAELNVIGPSRMRFPETLRIASGIQTVLGAPEERALS